MSIELATDAKEEQDYGLSAKDGEAIKQWILRSHDNDFLYVVNAFKAIDAEIAKNIEWQKKADDYLKSRR